MQTSEGIGLDCSREQVASRGGSGDADRARSCCGRPLAAVADLTAALCGSRDGLAHSGEWLRSGVGSTGEKRSGARIWA